MNHRPQPSVESAAPSEGKLRQAEKILKALSERCTYNNPDSSIVSCRGCGNVYSKGTVGHAKDCEIATFLGLEKIK